MKYSIELFSYDSYILLKIKGEWSTNNYEEIIEELFGLFETPNKLPKLIDIREMISKESVVNDYFDASMFCDKKFWQFGKIAVFDKISRKKENDFFEITASNRGLQFRFFYNDVEEALNWLNEN